MDEMKTCQKCGEEKFRGEFQNKSDSKDGKQRWCRECMNAYMRERYYNDPVYKARRIEASAKSRKNPKNQRQVNARRITHDAQRRKLLPMAADTICAGCGVPATETHHPNYDYPLMVVFYCHDCHGRAHMRLNEEGVAP